jgi:hypothetical protein
MLEQVLIIMRDVPPFFIVVTNILFVLEAPFTTGLAILNCVRYLSHIDAKKDIILQTVNAELLKEVIAQMEKDLAMSAMRHDFHAQNADQLIQELSSVLNKQDRVQGLSNLLYRIDLPESQHAFNSYEELALALWNRVSQKVWLRRKYKK